MTDTEKLNALIDYIRNAEKFHLDNAKKGMIGSGYKSMAIQDIQTFIERELNIKKKEKGYLFLNKYMSWESDFSFQKEKYTDAGWYIAAEVSNLKELMWAFEEAGFDSEYIFLFIERVLSHDDYNILTQKGN